MQADYRIGMHVIAVDGDAGQVEDVLTSKDGTPRYLVVQDNGVFASDAVILVDAVSVDGTTVRCTLTRAQLHAGERFDAQRFGEGAGLFSTAADDYERRQR
jgi:hypothetical protein